jgi:DNA-binding SARP family transcriptional activator
MVATRRYRVLGGLEVIGQSGRLELGTRKQRALLAVLLLAEGRVVSGDRVIDALWGERPPERADASIQSYVSGLRRVLEPDRAPRAPASVLITRGNGYALLADREQVDAWHFTDLVERARTEQAGGQLQQAAITLRNALAMYAPLLPEFETESFSRQATEHLEQLHLAALELSYEVRLDLGEHALLVADLETGVQRHPLHEGLWALLAIARYRAGRQSDALQAIADARRVLAEEIGVDPGPRLRRLERDLLHQSPGLDATRDQDPATSGEPAPPVAAVPENTPSDRPLIGRLDELAILREAVLNAVTGQEALILVEGEPGVGKTALLEEATSRAEARGGGLRTLWGRCVDGEGAPAMWPWVQILTRVLQHLDDDERSVLLDTELGRLATSGRQVKPIPSALPDPSARFRLFDQAGQLLDEVAARFPLIIVIDDLQWADSSSLALFVHLAARRPGHAVLIGAMRDQPAGPGEAMTQALAALSRLPGHRRIQLGPLTSQDIGELIRQETGGWPAPEVIASVRSRTDGNPFFVRELSRLLQASGPLDVAALASAGVPSGVRDVVRGRLEGAGPPTTELLQLAALIGREVDLGLLARAADLDVEQCLERLEPAETLALLRQTPDDPFSFRFAHDLVRESIAETIPRRRNRRLHLLIADALVATGRGADNEVAVEQVAHHLWSAGPLASPERTVSALLGSAQQAIRRYAYADAEQLLQSATTLARTTGSSSLQLDVSTLLRSLVEVRLS